MCYLMLKTSLLLEKEYWGLLNLLLVGGGMRWLTSNEHKTLWVFLYLAQDLVKKNLRNILESTPHTK